MEKMTFMDDTPERDNFLSSLGVKVAEYLPAEIKNVILLNILDRICGPIATNTFIEAIASSMLDEGIGRYVRSRFLTTLEATYIFLEMGFEHQYRLTVKTLAMVAVNPHTHQNWRRFIVFMSASPEYTVALTHVLRSMLYKRSAFRHYNDSPLDVFWQEDVPNVLCTDV